MFLMEQRLKRGGGGKIENPHLINPFLVEKKKNLVDWLIHIIGKRASL